MDKRQRIILTRLIAGFLLASLIMRYKESVTPSTIQNPPLFLVQLDITYWAYKLAGLHALIIEHHTGALGFDLLIFGFCAGACLFPLRRIFVIPLSLLLFLYLISINGASMHHLHMFAGAAIVLWPFWAADNNTCLLLWQAMRYYTCFLYAMAFVWKAIFLDSFFYWNQGLVTFKANLVGYLYYHPRGLLSDWYRWCIREDWFLNLGCILVILLEGLMVIGLFTKKWDRVLIWFPVIIHLATYFFCDVFFIELLVLDLSLLSMRQIDLLGRWLPFLQMDFKLKGGRSFPWPAKKQA